jgi:hypothetical protein
MCQTPYEKSGDIAAEMPPARAGREKCVKCDGQLLNLELFLWPNSTLSKKIAGQIAQTIAPLQAKPLSFNICQANQARLDWTFGFII